MNRVVFAFLVFSAIAAIMFFWGVTYQNLCIINAPLKKGMITDIEIRRDWSRETPTYKVFLYTVQIENKKYYTTCSISTNYKTGDVVRGYIRGKKEFILTEVNGVKVGNKYGISDYIFLILSLLTILIAIYGIRNIIKKNQ